MTRRTRVSRRHAIALMVAGLGVLAAACGPGSNPGAAPKTESKPAEPAKPAADAKPAASPAAAAPAGSPAAAAPAGSPAAAASPGAGASAASAGAGVGVVKGPFEGEAKQLTGAGATFPAPLYTKWFNDYKALTGVEVN